MSHDQEDGTGDDVGRSAAVRRAIDFRVRVPVGLHAPRSAPPENTERYEAVLGTKSKIGRARSLDDLLREMDADGVHHAVMHAEYEVGDPAEDLNRAIADVVAAHPDRFTGIGTVSMDPYRISRALRQVMECIDMGMVGISLQPGFFGLDITDRSLYPIYAKAEEEGLLVALHTGINYTTHRPMAREHPMQLDEICCDFNDLTVVASHAGWPWTADMVAVARRHPNVYLEFGGLAPRYVGEVGSGWEVVHRFMNSLLSTQILFATDWPVMDHQRAISEWERADLKPDVLDALLCGNAQQLLAGRRTALGGDRATSERPSDLRDGGR